MLVPSIIDAKYQTRQTKNPLAIPRFLESSAPKSPTRFYEDPDFGLWTRLVVRKLIAEKFGVNLGVTAVGKLLAKLGLTPQKPLKRAYERDPAAIAAWKRDTYPSIARRAKRRGADIYFWDESGFRADAVQGTTWSARGQTAIVPVPGQRQSVSAASAVNARGGFWFATYKGGMSAELFIEMLKVLMRRRRKPLYLLISH